MIIGQNVACVADWPGTTFDYPHLSGSQKKEISQNIVGWLVGNTNGFRELELKLTLAKGK